MALVQPAQAARNSYLKRRLQINGRDMRVEEIVTAANVASLAVLPEVGNNAGQLAIPSRINSASVVGFIFHAPDMLQARQALESIKPQGADYLELAIGQVTLLQGSSLSNTFGAHGVCHVFFVTLSKKCNRGVLGGPALVFQSQNGIVLRPVSFVSNSKWDHVGSIGFWIHYLITASTEKHTNVESVGFLTAERKLELMEESLAQRPALQAVDNLAGDDLIIAQASRMLDRSATCWEDFIAPSILFCQQHPKFWLKSRQAMEQSWRHDYNSILDARRPALDLSANLKPMVPGGFQDACTCEISLRPPLERRIIYLWGDKGVGKTNLNNCWKTDSWWAERGVARPRVLDCSSIETMRDLLPLYTGQRVLSFTFERDGISEMSKLQSKLILMLSDIAEQVSGKHRGNAATIAAHIVVQANEPPPRQWLHKEIWLLKLAHGAHRANRTVWHFPGEAPRTRALHGLMGEVSYPWRRGSGDDEVERYADIMEQWMTDSRKVYSINDLSPNKRARITTALSPRSLAAVDDLLRTASLEGVFPGAQRDVGFPQ